MMDTIDQLPQPNDKVAEALSEAYDLIHEARLDRPDDPYNTVLGAVLQAIVAAEQAVSAENHKRQAAINAVFHAHMQEKLRASRPE